jgi:hypothetical protein
MGCSTKSSALILITVIFSIMLIGSSHFGLAQSGTSVSGAITSNTTWTKANSPYDITGNVTVNSGVTLTIQPGVKVISKNNYALGVNGQDGVFEASLTIEGTLVAVGDNNNPIIFNDTTITFSYSSIGWNPQINSGSIIKRCFFEDADLKLDSSPKIDSNLFSGSTYSNGISTGGESTIYINGGSPVVSNNYMTNNSMQSTYGWSGYDDIEIANGNNATIIGNVIADGMEGIGVDRVIESFSFNSLSGTTIIENNLITNNKGSGISCGAPFPLVIENDTITQNYIGLYLSSFSTKSILINNNIYNNTGIFDDINRSVTIESSQSANVNATYNYWGTTDQSAISNSIHDHKNDSSLGTVNFVPFLNEPNSQSTPSPKAVVPEFSLFVILPLFITMFFVAVMVRHRKTAKLNQ